MYDLPNVGSKSKEEACGVCPKGAYCQVGSIIECPKGTYNDELKKTSPSDCKSCVIGTYRDAKGAKEKSDCLPCDKDSTGKQLSTKTDKSEDKKDCKIISFSCPDSGQRPISDDSRECENCPKGTYSDGRGESCTLCPIGYFQEDEAQTKCKKCIDSDMCSTSMMPGATSQTDSLKTASLPIEFAFAFAQDNYTDKSNRTAAVSTLINKRQNPKKISDGLGYSTSTAIIVLLGSIALTFVLFHRYLPMRFKDADLLYAGFHFIEDTVSIHKLFCFGVFIFIHSLRIHQNQI